MAEEKLLFHQVSPSSSPPPRHKCHKLEIIKLRIRCLVQIKYKHIDNKKDKDTY